MKIVDPITGKEKDKMCFSDHQLISILLRRVESLEFEMKFLRKKLNARNKVLK